MDRFRRMPVRWRCSRLAICHRYSVVEVGQPETRRRPALPALILDRYRSDRLCIARASISDVALNLHTDARRFSPVRKVTGGWGGIRTHGEREPTPVFKTGALNRSATHPVPCAYSTAGRSVEPGPAASSRPV